MNSSAAPIALSRELVQTRADWIRGFAPWEVFGTFSYKYETSEVAAQKHFKKFLGSIAKLYGVHVSVATGEDYQARGAYHHHFLIAPMREEVITKIPSVTIRDLETLWQDTHSSTGHARIVRYDPSRGAAYYLAKHQDLGITVACPRHLPCRRPKKGCRVLRSGL